MMRAMLVGLVVALSAVAPAAAAVHTTAVDLSPQQRPYDLEQVTAAYDTEAGHITVTVRTRFALRDNEGPRITFTVANPRAQDGLCSVYTDAGVQASTALRTNYVNNSARMEGYSPALAVERSVDPTGHEVTSRLSDPILAGRTWTCFAAQTSLRDSVRTTFPTVPTEPFRALRAKACLGSTAGGRCATRVARTVPQGFGYVKVPLSATVRARCSGWGIRPIVVAAEWPSGTRAHRSTAEVCRTGAGAPVAVRLTATVAACMGMATKSRVLPWKVRRGERVLVAGRVHIRAMSDPSGTTRFVARLVR